MFGRSNKEKYDAYLKWFEDNVKDPVNWSWMHNDRDCQNYQTPDQKPIPYSFNEAAIRCMDPKVWDKALTSNRAKQRAFVKEQFRYVGGNPANGLINPEYVKNEEARIAMNRELHRSYSTAHDLKPLELVAIQRKYPQTSPSEPQPKEANNRT